MVFPDPCGPNQAILAAPCSIVASLSNDITVLAVPQFAISRTPEELDHSPGVPGKPGFGLLGWRRPRLCFAHVAPAPGSPPRASRGGVEALLPVLVTSFPAQPLTRVGCSG